jgi:hypothetical protein
MSQLRWRPPRTVQCVEAALLVSLAAAAGARVVAADLRYCQPSVAADANKLSDVHKQPCFGLPVCGPRATYTQEPTHTSR